MYISYSVTPEDHGMSAQAVLKHRLFFSQVLLRKLKKYRALHVNGEFVLHKTTVQAGDLIEVDFTEEGELEGVLDNPGGIPILYEDAWLALVAKPPGLPSHPRFPGDPGLSTRLSSKRVHLINRLDLDTSGLTIIGKNPYAHDLMSRTPITKVYLALVHGIMPDTGIIDLPIARKTGSIIEREVHLDNGQKAISHFVNVCTWPKQNVSLVGFRLETGRTHQIRVHAQYFGHPLVGDTLYGTEQSSQVTKGQWDKDQANSLNILLSRQFLHAYQLEFEHPILDKIISTTCDLPEDLRRVIDTLNNLEDCVKGKESLDNLLCLDLPARNIQNNPIKKKRGD